MANSPSHSCFLFSFS